MSNCAPNQNSQSISIPSGQWYPVQAQLAKTEVDADSVFAYERDDGCVCSAAAIDSLFIHILLAGFVVSPTRVGPTHQTPMTN